jgi:predicted enzyme related to lactoylglutathione lyase
MLKQKVTIDTVIIFTPRMRELAQFYQDGLQLDPPHSHSDNHLGFPLEGTYLGFDQADEPFMNYPGGISLWFRVNDLEATFNRFKELGAKVRYPPTEKPFGDVLASLFDLDGNMFGLAQRKPEATD